MHLQLAIIVMAMYLNKKTKISIWLTLLVLFLIVIAFGTFLYTKKSTNPTFTASTATKGPSTELPKNTPVTQTNSNSDGDKEDRNDTSASQIPPEKPTGIFVSNHRPKLSGENLSNQINSVCTTTSGAACTIVLTKNGKSISLQKQETDNGGSTYWTWKLQDYGITEGTWKVEAAATLNGQTATTKDPIDMVVER
jgi:hypothetical protein